MRTKKIRENSLYICCQKRVALVIGQASDFKNYKNSSFHVFHLELLNRVWGLQGWSSGCDGVKNSPQ